MEPESGDFLRYNRTSGSDLRVCEILGISGCSSRSTPLLKRHATADLVE